MLPDGIQLSVSSTELEKDVKAIRSLMGDLGRTVHASNPGKNFVLGSEAVFAMGWYFYELSVSRELVRKLANMYGKEILNIKGSNIEEKFCNWLMDRLRRHGCGAKIKLKSQKEFRGLWPWLLK